MVALSVEMQQPHDSLTGDHPRTSEGEMWSEQEQMQQPHDLLSGDHPQTSEGETWSEQEQQKPRFTGTEGLLHFAIVTRTRAGALEHWKNVRSLKEDICRMGL